MKCTSEKWVLPLPPKTTTRTGPFHSAVIYLSLYKPTVSLNLTLSAGPTTLHWFRYLSNSLRSLPTFLVSLKIATLVGLVGQALKEREI